jgi:hypothetical protein
MYIDPWAIERLKEVAPAETIVHCVRCKHGKDAHGYFVATDRCMWWLGKQLFFKPAEEFDYSNPIKVTKSWFGGCLTVGGNNFQMPHASAQKFAGVIHEMRSQMAAPAAPSVGVADELKKLAELRDGGILTAEEFESKKAELL